MVVRVKKEGGPAEQDTSLGVNTGMRTRDKKERQRTEREETEGETESETCMPALLSPEAMGCP